MLIKSFSVLLVLTIIICKAYNQSLRILSSNVTNKIKIPYQDAFFYLVAPSEKNPQYYRMILSLYSSEIIFVEPTDFNFRGFQCKSPYCARLNADECDISVPRFDFHGYRVQASGYLDKDYWFYDESDTYKPIVVTEIKNGTKGYYPMAIFDGILGLGRAQNGRHFPDIFAIEFEQNNRGDNINLVFGSDLRSPKLKTPVVSWPADENWHVHNIKAVIVENSVIDTTSDHKVIFDLNIDGVVFPEYFQDKILDAFKLAGFMCKIELSDNFELDSYLNCTSIKKENKKKLPIIKIEVNGTILSITPEIYGGSPNPWVLHRLRFSSVQTTSDYITSKFQHYIILGRKTLEHYHVIFDGLEEKIFLYKQEIISDNSKSESIFPLHNILIIAIIIVILCILRRKYQRKSREEYEEFMDA